MENIGQIYLEKIFEQGLPVTIFLTCNVKLSGLIKGVDMDGILVEHEGRYQYIYKHAISTVSAGSALKEDDLVR